MKLSQIVKNSEVVVFGDDVDVLDLCHKSSDVKNGSMFFCLKGSNVDGHDFAGDASRRGASVVVSERKLNLPKHVTNVVVPNSRRAMSEFAVAFFEEPKKDLFLVSVTGTNGKTTTTFLIAKIFEAAGKKVGVIGTNGIIVGDQKIESGMTTPDPIELQKTLSNMRNDGVQVVVMEMSAHALFHQKNWGLMSDIAIFSNLTQDHLDFFSSMENYGAAKKLLFTKKSAKFAVLNADDDFSKNIIDDIEIPYVTYGKVHDADFFASNISGCLSEQEFTVRCDQNSFDVHINLGGRFNVSNALSAIAVAKLCGIGNETIARGLDNLKSVPGRFNMREKNGKRFVVDYAHTPDGLENILRAARELLKMTDGRLISVFGCGGNRDPIKRPIMGEISSRLADITIVTSDNPRHENPEHIIKQILDGTQENSVVLVESDRKKAIELAAKIANSLDIVVISGKGAEDYMDISGSKIHFSDMECIDELCGR